MNSKDQSKFKIYLYNILNDLNHIEQSDVVFQKCVKEKLDNSYEQYQFAMRNIYNYILSRSNVKVVKALARIKKKKEKANGNNCK